VRAEIYTGPQVPGVEKYTCGEYEVKGKFKKREDKKNKIFYFYLLAYAETSREYKLQLFGDLEKFRDGEYLALQGRSYQDWKNLTPELHVSKRPKIITEMNSLENTVKLIKSRPCK
jgi:hypothetical protein